MGAWIETNMSSLTMNADIQSHPEWVRGLKPFERNKVTTIRGSHPEWVRGLKLMYGIDHINQQTSHPEWVRGLKPTC